VRTATAQLPEGGGEDRVYATGDTVLLLDGASAFRPVPVRPSEYVDALGAHLMRRLNNPAAELAVILGEAIDATARELDLKPGHSPSSTVAIVRRGRQNVECLILGDNLIVLPGLAITDERLSRVGQQYRHRYRERLKTGHGYDQEHREVLQDLQAEQARHRNKPGGYWIAEADPAAADRALIIRQPLATTPWAILASDGAYKPMTYLGLADWPSLGTASDEDLEQILSECQRWEEIEDPNGQKFPRAKRHDDKTLAVKTSSGKPSAPSQAVEIAQQRHLSQVVECFSVDMDDERPHRSVLRFAY
jgi:hypothetical protein